MERLNPTWFWIPLQSMLGSQIPNSRYPSEEFFMATQRRNRFTPLLMFMLGCFLLTPMGFAQDQDIVNQLNIGLPPNGVFSGSDFDSVQINNGNLHIELPLWSMKGRG